MTTNLKEISNSHAISLRPLTLKYTDATKKIGRVNDPITPATHKLKVIDKLISSLKMEKENLRNGLINFMKETGCITSDADGWTVSLAHKPKRVVITDRKHFEKNYPDYFKPQPPKLDETKVRKLLEYKEIDGAHLEDGGDTISIRLAKGNR